MTTNELILQEPLIFMLAMYGMYKAIDSLEFLAKSLWKLYRVYHPKAKKP